MTPNLAMAIVPNGHLGLARSTSRMRVAGAYPSEGCCWHTQSLTQLGEETFSFHTHPAGCWGDLETPCASSTLQFRAVVMQECGCTV